MIAGKSIKISRRNIKNAGNKLVVFPVDGVRKQQLNAQEILQVGVDGIILVLASPSWIHVGNLTCCSRALHCIAWRRSSALYSPACAPASA